MKNENNDKFTKGVPSNQEGKTFEQDYDDGMMFFHSHSLWEAMQKLERFYECKIYGVLEVQEVVDYLQDWNAFDKECEDYYLCDIEEVGKQLWLAAIESAYDNICGNYDGYEQYLEYIYDYVVDAIKDAKGL